jgi:hypothetical protein
MAKLGGLGPFGGLLTQMVASRTAAAKPAAAAPAETLAARAPGAPPMMGADTAKTPNTLAGGGGANAAELDEYKKRTLGAG